jgi:VWFA-related protein
MRKPIAFALAVLLAPPVHAQQAVPGTSAEVVQLDVVVTDENGRPVRNLTQADFEVREDGKPQALSLFVPSGTNAPPPPALGEGAGVEAEVELDANGEPKTGPGRNIAVVVDDLHIAPENIEQARRALRRLPRELMGEDDSVALVTTAHGVLQQFTKDAATLGQAIERLIAQAPAFPPAAHSQMTAVQAELILRGDRGARKLAAKTLIAEPGSIFDTAGPRAAAAAANGGGNTSGAGGDSGKEAAAEDEVQRQARGVLAEALRFSVASLAGVEDVLRGMSARPGRKLCLLISDGFLVGRGTSDERARDLQRVTDAATRSGAVVYTLDTRGLLSGGSDASIAGSSVQPEFKAGIDAQSSQIYRMTLREIAADTGGFMLSGTNEMAAGIGRMLADNAAYYLMAYAPTNPKHDGRFRRIKVRLPQHASYEVRTRAGYFARDAKSPVARPVRAVLDGGLDLDQAREVLDAPLPGGGIPVRLGADFLDLPSTGSQALVRAHVELAGLAWDKDGERNHATLELLGSAYSATGHPVGKPFGQRAELDFSDAELKRAVAAGLEFQQALSLPPGTYEVRLVARERRLGQVGGGSVPVEIPDLAKGKLAVSGVFLASAAAGKEPSAEPRSLRRFKKNENLYFQIYAYNVTGADDGNADAVLQAQIWSHGKAIAASKPQPVKLRQDGDTPLPETNEIGLSGLAAGPYELRVVVFDRKASVNATRTVDFEID